jgi:membrane-bound lytic murein transglycosylase F
MRKNREPGLGRGRRATTLGLAVLTLAPLARTAAAQEAPTGFYVLNGDLAEIRAKGSLRFLVHGEADYLPRNGDPKAAEHALARALAQNLGLTPIFVPVAEQSDLLTELNEGHGDVIVASLAVTPKRSERIAFTRPIRFVDQVVVVRASDTEIQAAEDLAGQAITVRESSSYAENLSKLADKAVTVKPAPENVDTFELLQRVGRGEERITVADSDIFAAAKAFAPNIRGPFTLAEKQPIAWGLRKKNPDLKAAIDAYLIENALTLHSSKSYLGDLDAIKEHKVLRVLTRNSSTNFFVYKGEQLGFEFEFAQEFAKSLDVRLEIIIPPSRQALFEYLEEGRGDLIAAGTTITPERERKFAFSVPYQFVSELLIVPAKDTTTQGLSSLEGKKVSVRKSSSYYETLVELQGELGFEIDVLPETLETEDVLSSVGAGKLAATIADSHIVDVELTYNKNIRSVGPIGDIQEIGWAMRKDAPQLKAAADAFVKTNYKGLFYNMTVNKYFKNPKQMKIAAGDEHASKSGRLSPYDDLVKKHSRTYEMDWRLITAQMYQESRFDPSVTSWVGAKGLMQVMPRTAQELKVADVVAPDTGILAGTKLMARYSTMFNSPEVQAKDRIRFALASYNCGPGHVSDARVLAKEMGLDANKWFGNVERAALLLSKPEVARKARYGYCRCEEPVKYVSQIQSRYDTYVKLVPLL